MPTTQSSTPTVGSPATMPPVGLPCPSTPSHSRIGGFLTVVTRSHARASEETTAATDHHRSERTTQAVTAQASTATQARTKGRLAAVRSSGGPPWLATLTDMSRPLAPWSRGTTRVSAHMSTVSSGRARAVVVTAAA